MTQVWKDNVRIAVTKAQAGPCIVTQIKTKEKDGYDALQIGFGERKEKNIKKPQRGHLKKAKELNSEFNTNIACLKEFRIKIKDENGPKVGDIIKADIFQAGDTVKITSRSKGKGFQGVVKRYGFKGAAKSHGTKDQVRMPGSIGATGPAHVFKGTRMGGRMGGAQKTIANLDIVEVDVENNILLIKGGIPGARNGLVLITNC